MKRFLLFLTAFAFLASTALYAAPARNTKSSGTKTTKSVSTKKTSAKKTTAKKTTKKATAKKDDGKSIFGYTRADPSTAVSKGAVERGKEQQLGLMPSEIDILNHNVFHADAAAIKGARETEQALRYLPFVTIINTAGFGPAFDLRGQGRLSSNGVKMYINGVPVNPVDSYFSPMPLNTLIPSSIQEIEVFPGSGAVLYGSGTKGGTINVITSKRQNPYFMVGGGYVNTMASQGNSFNAFAQAAENFGNAFRVNAGIAASVLGGPREDDSSTSGQATLGMEYRLGLGNSISLDADVYYGKVKTTPYNSLLDFENINTFMLSTISLPINSITGQPNQYGFEQNRYACLAGSATCAFGVNDFDPGDDDRETAGYGTIDTTQIRGTARLNYFSQLAQRLEFNLTGFGNFDSKKYNTYKMNLPYFVLGFINPQDTTQRGYNWFLPRPAHPYRTGAAGIESVSGGSNLVTQHGGIKQSTLIGADGPVFSGTNGDGERADWHFFDQSGSTFKDYKFGGKARFDWRHQNGLFVFGIDATYEMSKRNSKSYLRQSIVDGSAFAGIQGFNNSYSAGDLRYGSQQFSALAANINDKTDINVLTAGVYFLERYDFNKDFSLGLGARYEMKNYDVKMKDNFEGKKFSFDNTYDNCTTNVQTSDQQSCDFVNYDNSNYNAVAANNRNAVVNGVLQTTDKNGNAWANGIAISETPDEAGDYSQNYDNFTFELAPVYRYSNTGTIYARGEFGYNAPPAWAMLKRIGIVWGASMQRDIWIGNTTVGTETLQTPNGNMLDFDFTFEPTNLKSETYYTAELGWKETMGKRIIPLGFTDLEISALLFSANIFYTGSQNEFYFEGDTWSGMTFGNYKESRRIGAELAFEQIFFDGGMSFNESFTYLKAEKKGESEDEFSPIPYTYDWKATLGISVDIAGYLEIIDVGIALWLQNSIYGNQNIYAQRLNVANFAVAQQIAAAQGTTITQVNAQQEPYFLTSREDKKLDPYFISDIGASVSINKGMGVITVGVKNVFNTFYYDYYNNDRSAVVNENRYVIGRGRTAFIEGTFKY